MYNSSTHLHCNSYHNLENISKQQLLIDNRIILCLMSRSEMLRAVRAQGEKTVCSTHSAGRTFNYHCVSYLQITSLVASSNTASSERQGNDRQRMCKLKLLLARSSPRLAMVYYKNLSHVRLPCLSLNYWFQMVTWAQFSSLIILIHKSL